MELRFFPVTIFRETQKVTFFDTGINKFNGSDVVINSGEAISPADDFKMSSITLIIIRSIIT